MKIYYNNIEVDNVKTFVLRRDNNYFLRLIGFNYSKELSGRIKVDPVYKPWISIDARAGQTVIDIFGKNELTRVILQWNKPRISVGKFTLELEDDE